MWLDYNVFFHTKAKNVVTLSVDDIFAQPGIGVPGVSSTDTKHGLFIGGHPKPERLTALEVTMLCYIYILEQYLNFNKTCWNAEIHKIIQSTFSDKWSGLRWMC
jgi:hypothetical protein